MTQDYPLESTDRERRRLKMQAAALVPLTERMLSGAGVLPGARVLELGCGSGDVTELIARRVGPAGEVIALDRDPSQVAAASDRSHSAGHRNVGFVVSEVVSFQPTGLFDAIVGRYFLMYVPDPEAVLAQAARWLRPGGSLGFLEMDFFRGVRSRIWPPASSETVQAIEFIADVMLDAGTHPDMAARLPSMLSHYGDVAAELSAPLQFGAASVELPLEAVRSVAPTARRLGRADADDHDVDQLLATEVGRRDRHTVTVPPLSVAAWVRVQPSPVVG
ncbi:class I SAM-dependent methyltransferase [Sphaerotilaceae bacterium SBD11-9]